VLKSTSKLAMTPVALDFVSGKPTPLDMKTTLQMLATGEFDVVLIVGNDALATLPNRAAKGLASTRTIYIGSTGGFTDHRALLSLRIADDIVSGLGTITRVDMKDIQFKQWGKTKKSTKNTFDVITQLHKMIQTELKK
jgi:formylmethanofuran dehydrogenase subunit B